MLTDNWRPITLLNNTYKILAYVLASYLKHAFDDIKDETLSGFMKNSHISNNILQVLDTFGNPELN